jgi:hypothetical protein
MVDVAWTRVLLVVGVMGCGRIGFDSTQGVTIDASSDASSDATGAEIVASGLALDLDPGNPASYPGSGTAIVDLSPFGNDGTIVGAPPFTNAGAGSYFTYDGGDSMFVTLGTATPAGWSFATVPRTLSAWVYLASNRAGYTVCFSYGTGIDGQGNYLGTSSDGTQWNFGGFFTNQYGGTATTGTWLLLTGVWDGTTASLYLNNGLLSSSAQPNWSAIPGAIVKIGVDTAFPGEGWNGRIGRVMYYNRALTAAEVMLNFNATRGRYGL